MEMGSTLGGIDRGTRDLLVEIKRMSDWLGKEAGRHLDGQTSLAKQQRDTPSPAHLITWKSTCNNARLSIHNHSPTQSYIPERNNPQIQNPLLQYKYTPPNRWVLVIAPCPWPAWPSPWPSSRAAQSAPRRRCRQTRARRRATACARGGGQRRRR